MAIYERDLKKNELRPVKTSTLQLRRNDESGFWKIDGLQDADGNQVMVCPNDQDGISLFSVNTKRPNINVLKSTPKLSISPRWWRSFEYRKDTNQLVLIAGEGIYYFDLRDAVNVKSAPSVQAVMPTVQNGEAVNEESWTAPEIRSAFAALDPRDDLSGLPPLVRGIARFLKDENVDFVGEEKPQQRDKTWKVTNTLPKDIPVAMINYIFDRYSQEIKANPRLTFDEFLIMFQRAETANVSDYVDIIRSAIQGQDKTRRAWVRELIQNARDAMRREREEKRLKKDEGRIEIRNFISQGDWIFSIRDTAGMNLWHLLRYYFPLDQTSKDHLKDTGNLGQGNYTLFADFDRVFIRTSTGDGLVHEIVIKNSDDRGPVIDQWDVMKGDYKGTEIRRIKEVRNSDPQLESLFIQEAMENFAGAMQPPQSRETLGQEPLLRDFEVTYNGQPFSEEIEMTSASGLGDEFGSIAVGRGKDVNRRRVIQDELFIKTPDADELKFVPQRILQAFERFGGLHISIGKEILLNIPRTGYAQKHKFLNQLRVAVLYNIMRTVLKDYMDKNSSIYAMPPDYFSNEIVIDNPEAQKIAELMYQGQYDQITETMLTPFIQDPIRFFELISHVPFTSNNHNGEINLHRLRELRLEENKIRRAREERARWESMAGSWNAGSLKTVFEGKKIGDEFSFDFGGREAIEGKAGKTAGTEQSSASRGLTPEQEQYFLALNHRVLHPIVADDMPQVGFFNDDSSVRARAGVRWGKPVLEWNLGHMKTDIEALSKMAQDPEKLRQSLEWETEGGLLWKFLETEIHESQHLPKFEFPGDHTHHSDETIDRGFARRMGIAFDALLSETDDIVGLFTGSDKAQLTEASKQRTDQAVLASPERVTENPGGIDFNPNMLNLQTQGKGADFNIPFDAQTIQSIQIDGFSPVIFQIVPTNLPLLFGLSKEESEEQLSRKN